MILPEQREYRISYATRLFFVFSLSQGEEEKSETHKDTQVQLSSFPPSIQRKVNSTINARLRLSHHFRYIRPWRTCSRSFH